MSNRQKKIIWKTGRAMGKNTFSGPVKQFVDHQVEVNEELMKRPIDVQSQPIFIQQTEQLFHF